MTTKIREILSSSVDSETLQAVELEFERLEQELETFKKEVSTILDSCGKSRVKTREGDLADLSVTIHKLLREKLKKKVMCRNVAAALRFVARHPMLPLKESETLLREISILDKEAT